MPRLGLTPVAEALAQLVGADEAAAAHVPSQALAWVAHTSILPSLLALCANAELLGCTWPRLLCCTEALQCL